MSQHVGNGAGAARSATWAALAAGLAGVLVFGSVVAGVGDWMEGRQLRTVGPWAVPGLLLGAVSGVLAIRALWTGRGLGFAVLSGLAVVTSVIMLFVVNPPIGPPAP